MDKFESYNIRRTQSVDSTYTFVSFTTRSSQLEKNALMLPTGKEERNHFNTCHSALFFLRPALRRNYFTPH